MRYELKLVPRFNNIVKRCFNVRIIPHDLDGEMYSIIVSVWLFNYWHIYQREVCVYGSVGWLVKIWEIKKDFAIVQFLEEPTKRLITTDKLIEIINKQIKNEI